MDESYELQPYYEELARTIVEQALRDYVEFSMLPDYRPMLETMQKSCTLLEAPLRTTTPFTLEQRKEMLKGWIAFNDQQDGVTKVFWKKKRWPEKALAAKTLDEFFKHARRVYNRVNLRRSEIVRGIRFRFEETTAIERFIYSDLFKLYTGGRISPDLVMNRLLEEVENRRNNHDGKGEQTDGITSGSFGTWTGKRYVKSGPA